MRTLKCVLDKLMESDFLLLKPAGADFFSFLFLKPPVVQEQEAAVCCNYLIHL